MKWILIILLIFIIMLIAKAVSQQYSDKFEFYYNLNNFLNQFKINLSFKHTKLLQFLNTVEAKKHFKIFIEAYKEYLTKNTLDLSQLTILSTDEIKELEDLILNIGKYDSTNEINQISQYVLAINNRLELAEKNKQKICPMIIKLSLLFAVGLAVILI